MIAATLLATPAGPEEPVSRARGLRHGDLRPRAEEAVYSEHHEVAAGAASDGRSNREVSLACDRARKAEVCEVRCSHKQDQRCHQACQLKHRPHALRQLGVKRYQSDRAGRDGAGIAGLRAALCSESTDDLRAFSFCLCDVHALLHTGNCREGKDTAWATAANPAP